MFDRFAQRAAEASSRRAAPLLVFLLLTGIAGTPCPETRAGEPDAQQLRRRLEAGEFGPARQMADRLADRDQRDRWLGDIAAAQARAGARRAGLATVSDIFDDRTRSSVLDRIASQPVRPSGGRGGAALADFDTLINLITTTVAPTTWEDVGGNGAIEPFPTGVYVDASGLLKRIVTDRTGGLSDLRRTAIGSIARGSVRRPSLLRKVSLNRLEKALQLRWAAGLGPDEAMRTLAGMHQLQYVLLYPESGDVVIAGPAGDWRIGVEGRCVNVETGRPVLQLDDLAVVLRNAFSGGGGFSCAISPKRENLARTQEFLREWAGRPLKPGQRAAWLEQLRGCLGQQTIEVRGIDPRTRAARVIVEADYRMKRVGMGLEKGVLGVDSYLDLAAAHPSPPSLEVLRWWFALHYDAIQTNPQRNAFHLRGPGVRVLSENELLTERGERIHTGESDELNRQFADSFTRRFADMAAKHPVYAELRNLFDLALAAAILRAEDLPAQAGWHMTHLLDPERYRVALGAEPKEVESVIHWKDVTRTRFIVGVSGGVSVDPARLVRPAAYDVDQYGLLRAERAAASRQSLARDIWWWD